MDGFSFFTKRHLCVDLLENFSNDDGDDSENVTIKTKLIESTTTTLLTNIQYISHRFYLPMAASLGIGGK